MEGPWPETQRLVEQFVPQKVMAYEGRPLAKIREIRRACRPRFPMDLLIWRPEELEPRYRWGDPIIREALDHGEVLHG